MLQHAGARPRRFPPGLGERQHHERDPGREGGDAPPIDGGSPARARLAREGRGDERHRHDAEGQVHEEDPAPGQVVGQETAHRRADHRGHAPHAREIALQARPTLEPEELADDRVAEGQQRARAEPLHHAKDDQLRHGLRRARECRAGEERGEPDEIDRTPSVEVREPAPERHGDRLGQQIAGEDPRVDVEATQARHDRRHRQRDDRGLDRRQEDGQHDRDQHAPPRALVHAFVHQWPPVQPAQRQSPRSAG